MAAARLGDGDQLMTAPQGHGPLFERDHWALIEQCRLRPDEFGALLSARFWEFAPPALAKFCRIDGTDAPLRVGDDVAVGIRFAGRCRVRVIDCNANSLTFATLPGHPEAGRITFGAYRHESGGVIFHIRSRARSSKRRYYWSFVALGTSMQSNTWSGMVERVASATGEGVLDFVYEHIEKCEDNDADRLGHGPTFIAEGN